MSADQPRVLEWDTSKPVPVLYFYKAPSVPPPPPPGYGWAL